MRNSSRLTVALLGILGSLATAGGALAHAPVVFPAHHAVTAIQLLAGRHVLATKPTFNAATQALLTGRLAHLSGANSALFRQTKLVTGTGILNGIKGQISQGNVLNGQIYGTFYQQLPPYTTVQSFSQILLPLGNNALNQASAPATLAVTNFGTFFTTTKAVNGSILPSAKAIVLASGLQREQGALGLLNRNALSLGQSIGKTGLTGGLLTGTPYEFMGGTSYESFGRFAYAFGNSPYNTMLSGTASTIPTQASYLNFLNKITIRPSSFQVAGQLYQPLSPTLLFKSNYFLFAGGSNSLNIFSNSLLVKSLSAPTLIPSFFKI